MSSSTSFNFLSSNNNSRLKKLMGTSFFTASPSQNSISNTTLNSTPKTFLVTCPKVKKKEVNAEIDRIFKNGSMKDLHSFLNTQQSTRPQTERLSSKNRYIKNEGSLLKERILKSRKRISSDIKSEIKKYSKELSDDCKLLSKKFSPYKSPRSNRDEISDFLSVSPTRYNIYVTKKKKK